MKIEEVHKLKRLTGPRHYSGQVGFCAYKTYAGEGGYTIHGGYKIYSAY